MNDVYLLLGSNMGDRKKFLKEAKAQLKEHGIDVFGESAVYETAAWGNKDQQAFLNQAIQIATDLPPDSLLKMVKNIERTIGRVDAVKWGPRLIDIDILLYGKTIMNETNLTIPHPYLPKRRFTLKPLAEIAGSLYHPVLGKTINELLAICPDESEVRVLKD